MGNFEELEIKILNVDYEAMRDKLQSLNATDLGDNVQKIYTYDCYDIDLMYTLAVEDYQRTKSSNSLKKIKRILEYIKPVITDDDKKIIKRITGYEEIATYIDNNKSKTDYRVLKNEELVNLIKSTSSRFFKWLRLRQTGDKCHLTMKYIYTQNVNYEMDEVKEVEIEVDNFEVANALVEEMGYFRKKLVEKRRHSFKLNNCNVELDRWPLINPYIEIEGNSQEEIYETAKMLGFSKDECKVMNTEDVYLLEGKDLTKYEELTFSTSILLED